MTDIPAVAGDDRGGAPREPLNRTRVLGAALAVMDAEGLDAVTMRRVGRELGVEAMSLYNHVRDKDDLLQGVKELVMSEFRFEPSGEGWEDDARRIAREWRRLLRDHPNVMTLITEGRKPMLSPAALRPSEAAFRTLDGIGLSDEECVQIFCAFGGYIFGFVTMEIGGMLMSGGADGMPPEVVASQLPPEELPRLRAVLPHLMRPDMDARFEYGLDLLIAGVRDKIARRR